MADKWLSREEIDSWRSLGWKCEEQLTEKGRAQLQILCDMAQAAISEIERTDAAAPGREDAAKIIERKARALTEEYCHGDAGPGGYVWTNKEAEWQVILLEELAEEIRNAKGL